MGINTESVYIHTHAHSRVITYLHIHGEGLFLRLQNLAYILAEVYGCGSPSTTSDVTCSPNLPDMQSLRRALKVQYYHVTSQDCMAYLPCLIVQLHVLVNVSNALYMLTRSIYKML